jgi:dual specificity tyrosine-phosphorylation-regulated kinase 2/3/4
VRKINGKKLSALMQANEETMEFVDFMDKCLEWKPDKRLTPDEAFKHPWIRAGIKELRTKMEQNAEAETPDSAPSG